MTDRFDLVVIGSGPTGEKAAAQAAYFGKRVAVVEREPRVGGDAARRAVIPSKTLRETALYLTGFRRREVYGLSLELDPDATLERLAHRKDEVVETTTSAVARNLERHGVEVVTGEGRLGPDRTVVVGDRTLEAEAIVIATGSRPYHPPGIPFDDPDVDDSEEVLALERLPSSMAVVGAGAVGCEYASIFTALGTEVTLVDGRERLIPFLDEEVSREMAAVFERQGMRVLTGRGLAEVRRASGGLEVRLDDGAVLRPERLLSAVGRAGNVEGLGLEDAGVETDARGRIKVDATYRTTAPGIYAAGDVIGSPSLASVGMEQGRVAVCHAFGFDYKQSLDPVPPFAVYTIPEAASVGLTEQEALAAAEDVVTGVSRFSENPRATITGGTEGFVKLVIRRGDRKVLGVHILGDQATELIHLGQAVLHSDGTVDRFISATYAVPSLTDAYKYAAYAALQALAT
ncbi:MAG TPA: Si-specific NAD(P)(+) transhydrogenase [Actinomycetota bacterium]|nr:Si-specific NAD(P)(+) transhydrogenase [Actinomycetota bacterium]